MMAPTIFDMCHLLRLSPIGDPFGPDYPDLAVSFSTLALNPSYSEFIEVENNKEGPVTN